MELFPNQSRVAVIIPCFNEEVAISKVVRDAKKYLPHADLYVFDNNSTDATILRAREAGAHVIPSPAQGKGYVIRHAFRVIDADYYLLIDGDDTYPLEEVSKLLHPAMNQNFAMVIGTRFERPQSGSFRKFHVTGNRIFSLIVSILFHQRVTDMLSGYRVLSRDLVDQLRIHSKGFELETDLTLQTITKDFSLLEVPIAYRARPPGSHSKLNTYRDGFFILKFIAKLMKEYRPLPFFCVAAFICFAMGLAAGWQPIADYVHFAYVYTVPRAILAASLMLLSFMFVGIGLILDSQIRSFNDQLVILHRLVKNQERKPLKKVS